jgi:hypothetical protein
MNTFLLICALLFTLGISWLNAHSAGAENAQSRIYFGQQLRCLLSDFLRFSCARL